MSTYISASKLFVAIIFNVICIFRVKSVGNDVGYSRVFVDADKVVSALPHFWESTGLCPPDPHQNAGDFLLSSDMLTNLALISSVPHLGIKQVRIHWLLNLVSANWSKSSIGIRYDYGRLDKFLLYMNSVRLRPGFELMGNPSSTFTDFEDPKQVREWRDFIGELARHYIDLFGVEEIRTWNFETWNEPDHHDFDNLTFTVQGFLNYYDACSEGLRLADPYLKFGGPGGSFRLGSFSKICWALLDHVSSGKNYFTGKNVRMDFISFHEKGEEDSNTILRKELIVLNYIRLRYPKLANKIIYNDEGDPMKGWPKPREWRGDVRYGAMVAKIVTQHQMAKSSEMPFRYYALLSNDNGFMNYAPHYFTQRTLIARIQINDTKPKQVQFIRKPIHAVMGLLSKLGDNQTLSVMSAESVNSSRFGVVSSSQVKNGDVNDNWQQSILFYNSDDAGNATNSITVEVTVNKCNFEGPASLVVYVVDNLLTNPYGLWIHRDSPLFPSRNVLEKMRKLQEPYRLQGPEIFHPNVTTTLTFQLRLPGVALLHICSPAIPRAVTGLTARKLTDCDVMLMWFDTSVKSKCILTYEVEFARNFAVYERINDDILFNTFHFSPTDCRVSGVYRVRVVNYVKQKSPFSFITIM